MPQIHCTSVSESSSLIRCRAQVASSVEYSCIHLKSRYDCGLRHFQEDKALIRILNPVFRNCLSEDSSIQGARCCLEQQHHSDMCRSSRQLSTPYPSSWKAKTQKQASQNGAILTLTAPILSGGNLLTELLWAILMGHCRVHRTCDEDSWKRPWIMILPPVYWHKIMDSLP